MPLRIDAAFISRLGKKGWPPMDTDAHGSKTKDLSASIRVNPWLKQGSSALLLGRPQANHMSWPGGARSASSNRCPDERLRPGRGSALSILAKVRDYYEIAFRSTTPYFSASSLSCPNRLGGYLLAPGGRRTASQNSSGFRRGGSPGSRAQHRSHPVTAERTDDGTHAGDGPLVSAGGYEQRTGGEEWGRPDAQFG